MGNQWLAVVAIGVWAVLLPFASCILSPIVVPPAVASPTDGEPPPVSVAKQPNKQSNKQSNKQPNKPGCVILLHGLARTSASMKTMSKALAEANYAVVNQGYPSRHFTVEQLAPMAIEPAIKQCPSGLPIHFVTHSMGGILLRQFLLTHPVGDIRRVVMLGPPNQGSEVVDKLQHVPGFEWINGPAGLQLGTDEQGIAHQLSSAEAAHGGIKVSVGIIAGSRSINLFLSTLIPGVDDGKVAVSNTGLNGMQGHVILPVTHPFMMKNQQVIEKTLLFLNAGHF